MITKNVKTTFETKFQRTERMIEMAVEHAVVLEKVNKVLGHDCKNMSLLETIEELVEHIEKHQPVAEVKAGYMDLDD